MRMVVTSVLCQQLSYFHAASLPGLPPGLFQFHRYLISLGLGFFCLEFFDKSNCDRNLPINLKGKERDSAKDSADDSEIAPQYASRQNDFTGEIKVGYHACYG